MHDNPYFVTQSILTQTEPNWGRVLKQMKTFDKVLQKHCDDVANDCKSIVYGGMWTTFWKYEGIQKLMKELVETTFADYQRYPKKDLNAEDLGKQFIRTFLHFHYGDSQQVGCFLKNSEFWKLPVGLIKTVNVYFAHTLWYGNNVSALECRETLDTQIQTELEKYSKHAEEWDKPVIQCIAKYETIQSALHEALLHLKQNIVYLPWCSEWKNTRNFFLSRGPGSLLLDRNDSLLKRIGCTPVYETLSGTKIRFDCPYGRQTIKGIATLNAKDTIHLIKAMYLQAVDANYRIDRLINKRHYIFFVGFFNTLHYQKCYQNIDVWLQEFETRYKLNQYQYWLTHPDVKYRQISSPEITTAVRNMLFIPTSGKSWNNSEDYCPVCGELWKNCTCKDDEDRCADCKRPLPKCVCAWDQDADDNWTDQFFCSRCGQLWEDCECTADDIDDLSPDDIKDKQSADAAFWEDHFDQGGD